MELVKIRTKKGRIVTLAVTGKTDDQIFGVDKYGEQVILPFTDIDLLLPVEVRVQ